MDGWDILYLLKFVVDDIFKFEKYILGCRLMI